MLWAGCIGLIRRVLTWIECPVTKVPEIGCSDPWRDSTAVCKTKRLRVIIRVGNREIRRWERTDEWDIPKRISKTPVLIPHPELYGIITIYGICMAHILCSIPGSVTHIPLPSQNGSCRAWGIGKLHGSSIHRIIKICIRGSWDTGVPPTGYLANRIIPASLVIKDRQEDWIVPASWIRIGKRSRWAGIIENNPITHIPDPLHDTCRWPWMSGIIGYGYDKRSTNLIPGYREVCYGLIITYTG